MRAQEEQGVGQGPGDGELGDEVSQDVEQERALAALSADSLPLVTLGLAGLYSALAAFRWVLLPEDVAAPLASVALVNGVCFTVSYGDQQRSRLGAARAHRLLGLCAFLVVADFLYYTWLAPGAHDAAMLALILVASGFFVLSTGRLLSVLVVAIGGFFAIRLLSPMEVDDMGWPLIVLPATVVAILGHNLRVRAVAAQVAALLEARAAERRATATADRLAAAVRSQQRMREVFESSPDLVRIVSGRGEMLYENGASRALLAATAPADLPSGPHDALGHYPEWAAQRLVEHAIPEVARLGVWSGESAILGRHGEEIPMSQVVIAHRGANGEIEAYSTVMRDISGQKASERDLRRELHISDKLAQTGRALLATRGHLPLLERVCQLACDVLGCDSTQTFLFRETDDAYVAIAGVGDPPELWPFLTRLKLPRVWLPGLLARLRREKWLDVRLGDDDGKHGGLLFIDELLGHDRSEAREVVARLRASGVQRIGLLALWRGERMIGFQVACYRNDRKQRAEDEKLARGFAHLVSLALENAQLVLELEHANALKSDFVSVVSHELRSPLNVILGYLELFLDDAFGTLPDEQRDMLKRIEQQGLQLVEHINETLDFGRLEAGRAVAHMEETSVAQLFGEIAAETQPFIERRDGEVAVRIVADDDLPTLHTDREKLKVVLKNLLGNALKFTEQGRVELRAGSRKGGVEFFVRDTGAGIAPEHLDRIFEPFRQLPSTPTRGSRGVGLGLNIAQRFAALLGGTIEVESEVGRGSTFRVWLPAGARKDARPARAWRGAEPARSARATRPAATATPA